MLELNKIFQGDCLELIKKIPDKFFDVCLTDFPYGVECPYKSFLDTRKNVIPLINGIMPELFRTCKRVAFTCGQTQMWLFPEPTWILNWYIPAGVNHNPWGFTTWSPILVYGKCPYLENGKGCQPDTIKHTERSPQNGHPCPKPINLWRKVLERVSVKETDIVLDPFIGSGTTAIAAIKSKRQYIGFELEQEYVNIANKRIENELRHPELF
ncbi:MAG: site-specific DNA-methyltransferase [Bacteroidetes bacterium]|nr:site-specific DNA-methyltransferase [Bacteroidota bacterium]